MKRFMALLLVLVLGTAFVGCGTKKAFTASKEAYDNIDIAYEITEQFGEDLYEAWRMGIFEDDEIIENGVSHMVNELSLTEEEIYIGGAYTLASFMGEDWFELSEEEKANYKNAVDPSFSIMEDDLFSYCVIIVKNAYIANGKIDEAQTALDLAKGQMRELGDKYSDYEHYPNLKGYYTTTSSFFEFCQNPTGSFEQVKETINDYRNEARDYSSDLDYIFED